MNSQDLQNTQNNIEQIIINEILEPMKDWSKINKYLFILKDIDSKRRKAWNNEKFGPYEKIADQVASELNLPVDFTADDIPF